MGSSPRLPGAGAVAGATYRSWFFDDEGPVAIICPEAPPEARGPLVDAQNPNYTHLQAYADLDALVELFGHIRAENDALFPVAFKLAEQGDGRRSFRAPGPAGRGGVERPHPASAALTPQAASATV